MKISQVINIALRRKGYTGTINEKMYQWLYDVTDAKGHKSLPELWQDFAGQLGERFNEYETLAELKAATPEAGTLAMAKDSPHLFVYENGKWEQSAPDPKAESLGTIQQSMLTEAQFDQAHEQTGVPDKDRAWVLADGRNIGGTKLATLTGMTELPDLRGAYLRMAGANTHIADDNGHKWDGGVLGQAVQQQTAAPTSPFKGSTNEAGSHKHTVTVQDGGQHTHGMLSDGAHYHSLGTYDQEIHHIQQQYHNHTATNPSSLMKGKIKGEDANLAGSAEGTSNELEAATSTDGSHKHGIQNSGVHNHSADVSDTPDHRHTVTVRSGGDVETSPKTFTVNYYVRVN